MRTRNLAKFTILLLLIFFAENIFILYSSVFEQDSNAINKNYYLFPSCSQTFLSHSPIFIDSDGDFGNYNFSGSGTRWNPYLIEGYNITARVRHGILSPVGIEIRDTSAFFVINGCVISSDWVGIRLYNVASGTSKVIGNNIISPTGDGGAISVGYMQNSTISNNICSNFMQGIHLNYAMGCTIQGNSFSNMNYQGINIRYSYSNVIVYNQISNAREHGIALVGTSSSNVIHHNILEDNTWDSSYWIDGVPKGTPSSQGYDEGSQNIWYDNESKQGNSWSDYFGFGSYQIDGPANSIDLYPKHTTGFTSFVIIIVYVLTIFSLVVELIIYRFYYKKKKPKV